MASAGLLKLLHSGLQDDRLLPPKGQPRIESFQKAFIKAGRFTTEWYRVDFDNTPAFGQTAKATIPRRGHLITRAFLMIQLPDILTTQTLARNAAVAEGKPFAGPTFGWTNSVGHALINQLQLTIGATPIDTMDGRLLEVLDEFHTPLEKTTTVNRMIGRHDNGFTAKSNGWTNQYQEVAVPLPFWFTRGDPSAALPIDAIGTDIVQISITFNPLNSIYTTTSRATNAQNKLILPPMASSPFYVIDPVNGKPVYGLNGNPQKSVLASQIPGIQMPSTYAFQDAYLLLEYVYIDKPEANRIRLGDISYPIVQHYTINPFNTNSISTARIPMRIPNPTRELYFFAHRADAELLNAPFLATRDLSGIYISDASGIGLIAPWWPDASGLNRSAFKPLVPAYSIIDSEPITSLSLSYEGRIIRYATETPVLFRSLLPGLEQRKTPWHNKYYYHIPFGTQHEKYGITNPMGHANLDKILNIDLSLLFQPYRGSNRTTDVPDYIIYIWAETYSILRVYGGRAGLLFGY
jgi:hypothetical protein